jgi:transketolase
VALLLSRQNLPVLPGTKEGGAALSHGAYIVADAPAPQVILIGAGSEVSVAMAAREILAAKGVACRVVSMPSWELFEEQEASYRESILPAAITARVSVEAGVTMGWERYVGSAGAMIGINRFGESGKGPAVMAHLGIAPENVAQKALAVLKR